ncbi:MAG: MEDS domain-containing protein [Nitrososphaera sp.]|uniref:MEDS domain-containing protein n=1 Tax=Nitrososphaera sp. TaxID=1971748 RepID=UPI003D6F2A22
MLAGLLYPSYRQHVMLLYGDDAGRTEAIANYISEGLKGNQLCVYASGRSADAEHMSSLSSQVPGFDEHARKGDLIVIDFKPFYESSLTGDLAPFTQLKERLEKMLRQYASAGKGDKMLVVADAADRLSSAGHLDQCAALESWWDRTHAEWTSSNQNITVVCPHRGRVLMLPALHRIGSSHSLTIDLQKYVRSQKTGPARILIAEREPDLQAVYRRYMDSLGLEAVVVASGAKCLESAFDVEGGGFDMIVLDTHLGDAASAEVAAKIRARMPTQRIVFTTTSELEIIINSMPGVNKEDVLVKPFRFSQLLALIRPKTSATF